MTDSRKDETLAGEAGMTRGELLAELAALRQRNRELEDKFSALVDLVSSVDAVLWQTEIGPRGELRNYVASANAIKRFVGVENEEYTNPESLFKYLHPDDRDKMAAYIGDLYRLLPSVIDFRLCAPDGTIKWVRALGKGRALTAGWVKASGIVLEIEDLQKYERELLRVEKNYRTIFTSFPDPMLMSCEGVIIEVNEALARLAEVANREDFKGRSIFEFIHPDDHQRVRERLRYWRERMTDPENVLPEAFECRCLRANGSPLEVAMVSGLVYLDDRLVILTTLRDITAIKETEQALRRSEELFRAFTEKLQAAVYTYDRDGNIRYVNQFMEELTGYSRDELAAIKIYDLVHPEYRELAVNRARHRLAGDEVPESYDIRILTKDGNTRWVDLNSVKLNLVGEDLVLGSAVDITVRKGFEQSLQE
ncbi:MAG: PAS domain S-box protein, partial [Deltaproteobacteria bacterium]|nr:PAS domain S-box protein [Deltaproteobacteria bacterium]